MGGGKMRVVVIGANGQLGVDLMRVFERHPKYTPVPLTRAHIDVRDFHQVQQVLKEIQPDVVINTAAFTRVDDCEDQPEVAFAVNALGAWNVARVCEDLGCILVQISTDYVFDGQKRTPYTEEDLPRPLNVYGVTKLAGEHFVHAYCEKHFIVRTSGLYGIAGSRGKGGNFVETMIRLAREGRPIRVVNDQVLSPTYTLDLAEKIVELMATEAYGCYHMTNAGQCSWYEFATQIFHLLGLHPTLVPITSEAYGAKARRPSYSVLANDNIAMIGVEPLRPWTQALTAYLIEKKGAKNVQSKSKQ